MELREGDVPANVVWPLPADERALVVHRELAWTYRQFGLTIGPRPVREALIGDRIRPERVIAAFDGELFLGYLAIRLDGTGPFTLTGADFRRHFGAVEGSLRFATMRLVERREAADEIFVDGFLVRPEARGLGIGFKLLEQGEAVARKADKRVFRVRVRADNPNAAAFYTRQGFVEEGVSEISWLACRVGIGPVSTYAKRL